MAQFHEDPALLTKEKLKSELLANNVPLPSADSKKDVYVQLYLKNLTVLNKKSLSPPAQDTFSSDEEMTAPLVSDRSRSGRVRSQNISLRQRWALIHGNVIKIQTQNTV